VFPRKIPAQARLHLIGGVLIVALAAATSLVVMNTDLHNPGTRSVLLLGGVLVTSAMLLLEGRDRTLGAYLVGFLLSFALFAVLAA
jgi:hypothetical protein